MSDKLTKMGMPPTLFWGYVGVLIFMMGDGLELAWISPYLHDHGLSVQQTAILTTCYGVTIAIGSWLSGVLVEIIGPRKVMLLGTGLYIIGHAIFVGLAIPTMNYNIMIPSYAIRGFGYPLFAYSFLVWVAYRSPQKRLGAAVGWFWFVFTGGLSVLGSFYSSFAIQLFGHFFTLWTAIIWVLIGTFLAVFVNRDQFIIEEKGHGFKEHFSEVLAGLTILKREPRVAVACVVRVINQAAQYAFPLFLPIYLASKGIATTTWLNIWGTIFIANIIFNLIFGALSDKIGWKNTISYIGGVGCAIFTLGLYFVPELFTGNVFIVGAVGFLWGMCLAGFVPISALVPSLVHDGDKGPAMAILNLGAGLCVFAGPGLVALFYDSIGVKGMMYLIFGLYVASAIMTRFLKTPEERERRKTENFAS
ncbi:MFS transporter [Staphylococcus cohnii]|uniref:MFS transporter n=1 Tax=Staphylococcus TaxID=1279 RepID=UPI000E69A59D|nr:MULTISPECIES: MFS transporter [Staphylococcus]MBA1353662.1 MFS transporter [Staphylococcus cohnii]MBA1390035.1 MFS transporter [Staphylococcus cohnii]MCE5099119.1 MFS transporter [Staphylococcus cohnii]MSU29972.1 MFS transporter [Staphylococcus sp. McC-251-APC-3A2]RIL88370.1 MFS transporter [Staphylococcus cohnii]